MTAPWLLVCALCFSSGCTALVDGATDGAAGGGNTIQSADMQCGETSRPWVSACPEVCTGGCEAGVCTIACSGKDACKDARVTCPDGLDCLVSCEGEKSCEKTDVECARHVGCEVRCLGDGACLRATLFAQATGTMHLVCADEHDACKDAEVRCDTNACTAICHGPSQPKLVCGESCLCEPCLEPSEDD